VIPLDGAGKELGDSISVETINVGYTLHIGEPTTWYLIRIAR
jgi:hypothetical protein